jgi:hypothetical protein
MKKRKKKDKKYLDQIDLKHQNGKETNTMKRTIAAILLTVGIALAGIGLVPESHAQLPVYRIGAICADGTQSSATGSGACSHHGGVMCWLYSDGTCR